MSRTMSNVETWLRTWAFEPDCNLWKYASIYNLSSDIIREFKDVINWNKNTKKQLLEKYGQKFYEEIFGRDE